MIYSNILSELGIPNWVLILFALNLLSFILMGIDKLFAKAHARRIPERILIFFCALFGALGGLIGMYVFRHKIRKPKFKYGVPLLLTLQLIIAYCCLSLLTA